MDGWRVLGGAGAGGCAPGRLYRKFLYKRPGVHPPQKKYIFRTPKKFSHPTSPKRTIGEAVLIELIELSSIKNDGPHRTSMENS